MRSAPSLARELISGLLLNPGLAGVLPLPRPDTYTPDGAALAALVDYCASRSEELTTSGILQYFSSSPHEAVLVGTLAMADDQGVTREHAEFQLRAGLDRWWELARRAGDSAALAQGHGQASPEEAERLRQLALVRQSESTVRSQGNTG